MPAIATRNLMDGMILDQAVTVSGRELFPEGVQVDRDVVARLVSAGVVKVMVTEESYGLAALLVGSGLKAEPRAGATRVLSSPGAGESRPRPADTTRMQANLLRLAHMFNEHRADRLMRELCRLAIKCAQERLISV